MECKPEGWVGKVLCVQLVYRVLTQASRGCCFPLCSFLRCGGAGAGKVRPFAAARGRVCPFLGHEQSRQLSKRWIPKEKLWIGYKLCKLLGEGVPFEL